MRKRSLIILTILPLFACLQPAGAFMNPHGEGTLRISLQERRASELDEGAFYIAQDIQYWKPSETAMIVVNMRDEHPDPGSQERIREMAPAVNEVISAAREQGVLIVHAPVGCTSFYSKHQAHKNAATRGDKRISRLNGKDLLDKENNKAWMGLGEYGLAYAGEPAGKGQAWKQQIPLIEITGRDAVSESGSRIAGLFASRGIRNVVFIGVHTNAAILEESFGLRNMIRLGFNTVLMRDLSDVLREPDAAPGLSHFSAVSLMNEYIETWVCPTMVSGDITGKKQFRFSDDHRPVVAFITAESEYRSNQRFPEFAREYLIRENINCEFAVGIPMMEGPGRHNIENLQILNDADLAVFSIRRRALEPEKMELIRGYVNSGRPVLGIRTASHAFDAKGNVPREGGGIIEATEHTFEFLAQWPEFDEQVIGGNYQGHYGHLKEGMQVAIVPGTENHPLLEGVDPEGFTSPAWLYKNRPLRSANAQVLLTGSIPGQLPEPVLWVNHRDRGKVVYTSLGHWDDWEIESFRIIMRNAVFYLLNL